LVKQKLVTEMVDFEKKGKQFKPITVPRKSWKAVTQTDKDLTAELNPKQLTFEPNSLAVT